MYLINCPLKPATGTSDPAAIFGANLTAWYKADTGVYKDAGTTLAANNDTVQQWNDQSGNGNNLSQATAGNRPTWKSASDYNSKNGVDFLASGVNYLTTAAQVVPSANTVIGCFVVGRMRSPATSFARAVAWTTNASLSTEDFNSTVASSLILRDNTNNGIATYFNSSELSIQAISLATNYRLGVAYNGANSAKTYVNNTASTAATHSAPNFGANGALRVGAQFAAVSVTAAWDGPILEVVLVNVAPTSQNLSDLDTYFTGKWGS